MMMEYGFIRGVNLICNNMKPIKILKQLDLVNWAVLSTGFQRSWVTKSDISDCSISLLSANLSAGDRRIIHDILKDTQDALIN